MKLIKSLFLNCMAAYFLLLLIFIVTLFSVADVGVTDSNLLRGPEGLPSVEFFCNRIMIDQVCKSGQAHELCTQMTKQGSIRKGNCFTIHEGLCTGNTAWWSRDWWCECDRENTDLVPKTVE